jgi:hypothetical protein
MSNTKAIGVAFADPEFEALTVAGNVAGGNTGVGSQFTAVALAGPPVRQGTVNVSMTRPLNSNVVWDGNPDCGLKLTSRNFAANAADTGSIRGLDISARNSGANLSWVNAASFGARNDSGRVTYSLLGTSVRLENYGTVETECVGLDVNMSIENDTGSPTKQAIRVRNTDASGMTAVGSVLQVSHTSTNGFNALVDLDGTTAGAATTIVSTTGTDATSFSGRIRIVMPSGASGWINVYSTSNA